MDSCFINPPSNKANIFNSLLYIIMIILSNEGIFFFAYQKQYPSNLVQVCELCEAPQGTCCIPERQRMCSLEPQNPIYSCLLVFCLLVVSPSTSDLSVFMFRLPDGQMVHEGFLKQCQFQLHRKHGSNRVESDTTVGERQGSEKRA